MPHGSEVVDKDLHFVIDPITRKIQNQSGKVTLIQHDHNSERFTFVVPRRIDDHDMSNCDRVEVHYNNIATGQTNSGLYEVDDLKLTEDGSYVTCSWLISKNATSLVGRLAFVVRFECTSENEEGKVVLDYAWSTQPYAEVKIVSGIYNTDEIADEEFADIIAQWKQDLVDAGIIESIEQTITSTEDEGANELTIKMSNGDTYPFIVRNGSKGYSAYDIAVRHGYEGSEEEWNAAVNEARVAAETAASNAEISLDTTKEILNDVTEAEARIESIQQHVVQTVSDIDRRLILADDYLNNASDLFNDAITVEENVMSLAKQAATSATNAATSEQNSAKSASNAAASEANATASATSAATSAQNASNSADSANSSAIAAAASAAEAKTNADNLNTDVIQAQLNLKGDSLYFDPETNLLYLMSGGEIVGDGVAVAASGGGASTGGSYDYAITLKNLLESRIMSFPAGSKVELEFSYSSVDEENYNDGPGVATVYVNNVKKGTHAVTQGNNLIDVSSYLTTGTNTVKVSVMNSEGRSKSLTYTITIVTLKLSTTLENYTIQYSYFTLYYTPVGDGTKTIYFYIDGKRIGKQTVASSGKSQSFTIPFVGHGGHLLEVWATMPYEDGEIVSEPIKRVFMFVDSNSMNPIIYMDYDKTEVVQGETLNIPYLVYDPAHETTDITLSVINEDGTEYSSKPLTVGRTQQNWVVPDYPVGNVQFKISYGGVSDSKTIAVTESPVKFETETDSLALDVNPAGRSNQEASPATWTDGNVTATFSNIGFSGADGWLTDSVGSPMLRILPGGEMTIPYQLFSEDRRDSGLTVEIEMSTNNIRDYDSIVLSCLSGGRGFKIASQYAELKSEQSSISMQFKEEDRVRLSFVVEPKALNRLIYVYVDGIMCGAIQYPEDDNFQQNPAAGIIIGAETSGIDIYRILLYTKGLTKNEIVDNYIAGRALLSERLAANARNDILNDAEEIVISKLPATLPYMIIACPELPQFKDDKKTCTITYVNPADVSRSFYAENVQIDVQGTSSAGYKKKNFKPKFKGGFTFTANGEVNENYKLRDDSIPVSTFCLKADVASSEGANNVELVRFYNDVCPYKTVPQKLDSRVRVGIDGLPIVVFWQNTDTGVTKFWGKYNFNNDKSTNETFGLTAGCESWEIRNNTSDRVIFKKSDYSEGWLNDFEGRYPDKNTDYTNLKRLTDWLVSTDRSAVDTDEEKAARLEKFKNEFEDYFVKEPTLFYYLFTEVFLMVDSRAKNLFPSTFDGVHWLPLPYDMDTAIGINNEGALVFDYDLEDTDLVNGKDVFNGQQSVLWCNVRDAFPDDLRAMYSELRSGSLFKYDEIIKRFSEHQAIWPEVIWNEDAYEKYLEPLINDKDTSYLDMLQGSKASQREWWLYNGLRYRDSKYRTGDAQKQYITLRCYQPGDITVTPYSHIWPRILYGSYTVTERGKRNVPTTLVCPLDHMDDTEVYIYSSDRLIDVGDLSHLMVGYADFTMANKLTRLKIGTSILDEDGTETYQNANFNHLAIGNNELLTELDVRNCINLATTLDLSGCAGIETIRAGGSSITGLTLPVGCNLQTANLPGTMANLTLRNATRLTSLTMEGYSALTTLRIENTPNVPLETIINGATNLERVRLVNVEWTATDEESLATTINRLISSGGLTVEGGNTTKAVVNGRVNIDSISDELLYTINTNFPDLIVVVNGVATYLLRYVNHDGSLLYSTTITEGEEVVDPVESELIDVPVKTSNVDNIRYVYVGWSDTPEVINRNYTIVAQFANEYLVRFMVGDVVYNTTWVMDGGAAILPEGTPTKESDVQFVYEFSKWSDDYKNVVGPTDVVAEFDATLQVYTVSFYNGETLLQTVLAEYGTSAMYTGETPVYEEDDYEFIGWSPEPTRVIGDISCYALYKFTGLYSVKIMDRTISGVYENDRVKEIPSFTFYSCDQLVSVSLPNVTRINSSAFRYCYKLQNVNIPKVNYIYDRAFYNDTALKSITLPRVYSIEGSAFAKCSSLEAVVLPRTSVCTLNNSAAFNETPIAEGSGYIYVPSSMVDRYKAANNWSVYAEQFRAIENYPEIVGGAV